MENKYNLEPCGDGSFYVKELEILESESEDEDNLEYKYLGVDYPIDGDEVWRFWIEYGYKHGESVTLEAILTKKDEEEIKELVMKSINT